MKFMVARTSIYDNKKPCKEAKKETCIRVDTRTVDDPAKLPLNEPTGEREWWYELGKNHRVENGQIMRDFDDTAWFVDLPTLEDLMKFIDKYGTVVVDVSYWNNEYYRLEIYDDYRE